MQSQFAKFQSQTSPRVPRQLPPKLPRKFWPSFAKFQDEKKTFGRTSSKVPLSNRPGSQRDITVKSPNHSHAISVYTLRSLVMGIVALQKLVREKY